MATASTPAGLAAQVRCAPKADPFDVWGWTSPEPTSGDRPSSLHLDEGAEASPSATTKAANLTNRAEQNRERQEPARQAERDRKARVVEFVHWARARNASTGEAAAVMGLPARTLSSWCRAWEVGGLETRPRGRPPMEVPADECGAVRNFLDCHGPIVGLPTLRSCYTHMPRVVLGEVLASFRDAWRSAHQRVICELEWTRPGAIWAMDFTHPPRLVDGVYPAILNVVDLGSRQQLLWLPTLGEDALTVHDALVELFKRHGAPLVMKSDNGPAFRAEATKGLLGDWSVFPLYSPPYCASYNGVCERANRTMKLMTAHIAERRDDGGCWRSEDLHEARLQANRLRRPWGALEESPKQR